MVAAVVILVLPFVPFVLFVPFTTTITKKQNQQTPEGLLIVRYVGPEWGREALTLL